MLRADVETHSASTAVMLVLTGAQQGHQSIRGRQKCHTLVILLLDSQEAPEKTLGGVSGTSTLLPSP